MILTIWESIVKEWNELMYWFEMNYSNPWLWIGLVLGIILFVSICFSYLNKEK